MPASLILLMRQGSPCVQALKSDWLKRHLTDLTTISLVIYAIALTFLLDIPTTLFGEELLGVKLLLLVLLRGIYTQLPLHSHVLIDVAAI